MSEALKRWLANAPRPALLLALVAALGALASWVWAVSVEVKDQKAVTAIAASATAGVEQDQRELAVRVDRVETSTTERLALHESATETRLARIEGKVDRLLEQVASVKARQEEKKP